MTVKKAKKQESMMDKYNEIKTIYKDEFVFYRLGDFYELFNDDAIKASQLLKITLTQRNKKSEEPIPMAGVPHHSAESYIAKLINEGYSVVICDQVGEVEKGKLVERKVTRIITPSTVSEDTIIDPMEEIKIGSVYKSYNQYAFAELNMSTGSFKFIISDDEFSILDKLHVNNYAEILYVDGNLSFQEKIEAMKGAKKLNGEYYNPELNEKLLNDRFLLDKKYKNKNAYKPAISSAGSIIKYIENTQQTILPYIKNLVLEFDLNNLVIDSISNRNLELIKNAEGETKKTLFTTLNETNSVSGSRKLKDWIQNPTKNIKEINNRLFNVEEIIETKSYKDIAKLLLGFPDIERISTRIALKTAKPLDLYLLRKSIKDYKLLKEYLTKTNILQRNFKDEEDVTDVEVLLDESIMDKPSQLIRDGNVIRDGYNEELDVLRQYYDNATDLLIELEDKEKKETGIDKLKFVYNKIDGFFIAIPNSKLNLVPQHYILKKELKNEKRYTIPQLRTIEEKTLTSNSKSLEKEKELFNEIIEFLSKDLVKLNKLADIAATIDVLNAFAICAEKYNYCKPNVGQKQFNIKDGRHPVIEKYNSELFVPNDFELSDKKLIMLTGANMGGKSTYMRQNALITIMAHMGSFVPATEANIKTTDRIFTRIGSGDNLSEGLSTFLVEMKETANILNNVTNDSFILIDEIGRGTSTFDGLSLAWAFADKLASIGTTIFSTHYFELTELENENIVNMYMNTTKFDDNIIFLHRIKKGSVLQSYGIEVAKGAGICSTILNKAKIKQKELTKISLNYKMQQNILMDLQTVDENNLSKEELITLISSIKNKTKDILN